MILFKDYHMKAIQRGDKTHTRRVWKDTYNKPKKGSIHLAKTQMISKDYFARLKIIDVYQERLGDITPEDALKEGGYTVDEFKQIWKGINKKKGGWNPDLIVWVVDFECIPDFDFKVGDKVRMSSKCGEYLIHGDKIWTIDRASYRLGFSEFANLKGFSGGFSTKFLDLVEAK